MLDLRLAVRALRASPIASIAVALSLALGIGANTAIFSLVDGLLLRTLPIDAPDRLVTISTDSAVKIGFNAGVGWNTLMFEALRERAQPFHGVAAWTVQPLDLAQSGERQPVQALIATGDFFTTLGVHTHALQIFRRRVGEQPEIRSAEHREAIQGLVDRQFVVVQALGPQVLVVAGQRRAILREHEADAVAPHEIGVGQMLDDLAHRPLARRLRLRKPGVRHACNRAPNRVRRAFQHIDGVARPEQLQNRRRVFPRLLGRARRSVRKD